MRIAESEHAISRILEAESLIKDALISLGYVYIASSESEGRELYSVKEQLKAVHARLQLLRKEED